MSQSKITKYLNITWMREEPSASPGIGRFEIKHVEADVGIDNRLNRYDTAVTLIHEVLEGVAWLERISLDHDAIDKLAEALAQFALRYGFEPERVFD